MNIDFKRLLPYVAMPVAFLLLVVIYFRPAFEGKILQMGDIMQYQQLSRETREFREKNRRRSALEHHAFRRDAGLLYGNHLPE